MHFVDFPLFFTSGRGDNFTDFLFAFMLTKPNLERGLKERICSREEMQTD